MDNQVARFNTSEDLKIFLYKNYLAQIKNFFGDENRSMRFLSSVMASVQKTPELLNCEPTTVINSFITMAQLGLMPSNISGEAYVLPYKGKAQFQMGYQGWITLFFRAGIENIRSEIVRKNDKFSYISGVIRHEIDIFKSNEERGEAIGAYVIAVYRGTEFAKAMNKKDILAFKKFSKSADSAFTPWEEKNDPELWMWKKTVLKQLAKLLPKNDTIVRAINEDNKDSIVSDRNDKQLLSAGPAASSLKMGKLLKNNYGEQKDNGGEEAGQEGTILNSENS